MDMPLLLGEADDLSRTLFLFESLDLGLISAESELIEWHSAPGVTHASSEMD
jgi:hypothetical protein